jgi:hypothetical protein
MKRKKITRSFDVFQKILNIDTNTPLKTITVKADSALGKSEQFINRDDLIDLICKIYATPKYFFKTK